MLSFLPGGCAIMTMRIRAAESGIALRLADPVCGSVAAAPALIMMPGKGESKLESVGKYRGRDKKNFGWREGF